MSAGEIGAEVDPREAFWDPEDVVRPALASRPWQKCCSVCAFLPHDPQHLGAEVIAMLRTDVIDDVIDFYCVHRTTTAWEHRICASAAALRRGRALERGAAGDREGCGG